MLAHIANIALDTMSQTLADRNSNIASMSPFLSFYFIDLHIYIFPVYALASFIGVFVIFCLWATF